jgi:hypothetical protein
MKQNSAASDATAKAVADELEKAKGGGSTSSESSKKFSFGAGSTPGFSMPSFTAPVSPAPATGGWGADLMKQNSAASDVTAKAVADELEKAKGGGVTTSESSKKFSFGAGLGSTPTFSAPTFAPPVSAKPAAPPISTKDTLRLGLTPPSYAPPASGHFSANPLLEQLKQMVLAQKSAAGGDIKAIVMQDLESMLSEVLVSVEEARHPKPQARAPSPPRAPLARAGTASSKEEDGVSPAGAAAERLAGAAAAAMGGAVRTERRSRWTASKAQGLSPSSKLKQGGEGVLAQEKAKFEAELKEVSARRQPSLQKPSDQLLTTRVGS